MIFAKKALLVSGWTDNVRLVLQQGRISAVVPGITAMAGDVRVDTLLPALGNLHSHSFQRAMAGMTECRTAGRDSFWTWREQMYRFVDRLTPEHVEAIAARVFLEMQEAGFASVGEFHYVHHQRGGNPYANMAELSARVMAAALATGIGLTHLPVLYTYGGAGQQALAARQLRFGNSVDSFLQLAEQARSGLAHLPADARLGMAPHSLRATSPAELAALLAQRSGGPVHIHVAEQPQEVNDIKAWLGARPVEWLLANAAVNHDWCLVHATHMTQEETLAMAQSGAVAGLCPITEANLGDGPFNGPAYLKAGGGFGIGSDSNVNISLTEELRTLEYSQRLRELSRNVMVKTEGSVGECLYKGAAAGGAQALGRDAGSIEVGKLADLVAIDSEAPALCALQPHQLLDGLVFAAKDNVVTDLWSAGRHCVRGGQHVKRDVITRSYRTAILDLLHSD